MWQFHVGRGRPATLETLRGATRFENLTSPPSGRCSFPHQFLDVYLSLSLFSFIVLTYFVPLCLWLRMWLKHLQYFQLPTHGGWRSGGNLAPLLQVPALSRILTSPETTNKQISEVVGPTETALLVNHTNRTDATPYQSKVRTSTIILVNCQWYVGPASSVSCRLNQRERKSRRCTPLYRNRLLFVAPLSFRSEQSRARRLNAMGWRIRHV